MKRYEYRFVEVPATWRRRGPMAGAPKAGSTFEACKEAIRREAADGWRFRQMVTPFREGSGVGHLLCYQLIFERELPEQP